MFRIKVLFILILTVCLITSGCMGSKAPDRNAASQSGGASVQDANNSVPADINVKDGILGNVKFSIDKTKTVSGDYSADGQALTLSLTDKDGLKWTLTVPDKALSEEQTITMTALTDIKGDILSGDMGGVLLYPDGLSFLEAATLSVSGHNIDKKSIILTGGHDGSNLDFACNVEGEEGSASAKIMHFSSGIVNRNQSNKGVDPVIVKMARASFNDNKELLNRLLKETIPDPAVPPDISLKCKDYTGIDAAAIAKKYVVEFEKPESVCLDKFLASYKALESLSSMTKDEVTEADSLVGSVVLRIEKKVDMLISKYYPQKDKLYACAKAILRVLKDEELLSVKKKDFAKEFASYFEKIADWSKTASDNFLDDITNKHEYSAGCAAWEAARWAEMFDMNFPAGTFIEKFKNAMTFDLLFEADVKASDKGIMEFNTRGQIRGIALPMLKDTVDFQKGSGEYTSFKLPKPISMKLPSKFTPSAALSKFDPCKNKTVNIDFNIDKPVEVLITPIGLPEQSGIVLGGFATAFMNNMNDIKQDITDFAKSEKEGESDSNGSKSEKALKNDLGGNAAMITATGIRNIFSQSSSNNDMSENKGSGVYHFKDLKLQDGNATAAEQTFTGGKGGMLTTVKFTLAHSPKNKK